MKKFILSVMTLCCAMLAQAENTDISTLDNVVYIEPVSIAAGSQYTLSVKMKNAVEAEGFGFDLYLPAGVSVATDGDGFPLVELSSVRTTPKKTNSFDAAFQSDGCLRVLAASTNASTISGNDGEVCLVTILVAANVSSGDYPMYLRNIAISDTQAQSHRTGQVESTITVTGPADTRMVLDETSTSIPSAATGVDVRVKRTIKANEWSTICLPFAMTAAQCQAAFGSEVQIADFTGYTYDEAAGSIAVSFSGVSAIEANHPYVIKVAETVSEFKVDGVDVNPQNAEINKGTSRKPKAFIGNYVAGTAVGNGCLFLNGGKFWYSVGTTKIKAFRGFFNFNDLLPDFEDNYAEAPRMSIVIDDMITSIEGINADNIAPTGTYTLGGLKTECPTTKGVYIVNGKKVVVK